MHAASLHGSAALAARSPRCTRSDCAQPSTPPHMARTAVKCLPVVGREVG